MRFVLIPPLGHDQKFYDPLVSLLGEDKCICLDYPYFDNSFPWQSENLIEELAQKFSKMIEHEDELLLVGVSLGATLSLRIKEILTDRIDHLYLISSGGHKVASFRKTMILDHLSNQGTAKFLQDALEVGSTKKFEESDFSGHFNVDSSYAHTYWDYYAQILWSKENQKLAGSHLAALVKASVEVNFESLITHYQDQISIIWGERDKVFSMRFYEKFKKLAPRSRFYLYSDIGHFSPLETPERIKDILKGHEKNL